MTPTPTRKSVSFDRAASLYDETRGGLRRGREVAEVIAPHLVDAPRVLEVGVGTGAVAVALAEMGREVVGIDLSPKMLGHAQERLGHRVACADAHNLPFVDAQFENAYMVWVLHLVADPAAVVAECARALQPGGRLVIAAGRPKTNPDAVTDINEVMRPLDAFRDARVNHDSVEAVQSWAAAAGLRVVAELERQERFEGSPAAAIKPIVERAYSYLWRIDEQAWTDVVQPVIDGLRALPDQDRKRTFRQSQPLLVFER